NGEATFTTIYPGWYGGRATHIHVEVYVNGRSVKVTQMAFPESITAAVYATGVYAAKGQNPQSNASDNVFSDGTTTEMATLTGSTASGYIATRQVGIAACLVNDWAADDVSAALPNRGFVDVTTAVSATSSRPHAPRSRSSTDRRDPWRPFPSRPSSRT